MYRPYRCVKEGKTTRAHLRQSPLYPIFILSLTCCFLDVVSFVSLVFFVDFKQFKKLPKRFWKN